ncbi:hypothetical protein BDW02DRAFT_511247 [Decorospora gaudefroyi]|uniref:Uncharacterized protein n=1 Tax=Decorospora gaudefroyi TaxID=184978 RepID=A0A6A5K3P3_9PLEO|nr:hypothetical protein BDW02DRAFT_511247 [Decorospora gaudefroyi]
MSKRKFSFNLAPVKIGSRSDLVDRSTPEPTSSQPSSHRRHTSKDTICDHSPYINRRVLDAQTDQELRAACRLILQNFKPSDHGMENTDPKLDFYGLNKRKDSKPHAAEVNVRMPTGAPTDLSSSSFMARRPSTKTRARTKADLEIKARTADVPVRANSSRKRADFGWLDERDNKRDEKLRTYSKTSIDGPRSATFRNDSDEDVALPVAVPSNYANAKMSSSAPTSVSLPSGRSVNRKSHNFDSPAAVADAHASEWMRYELEKQRQRDAANPHTRPSTSARPPSRAASIKDSVREYVFPGSRSRALSRAQSKESLRSTPTSDDQGLSRSGSGSGWRSWGLPLRSSSKNSRPGSSKGQAAEAQPRKSESNAVNLNRELPPLPSLATWKEPGSPAEVKVVSPKSPTAGTHIASLMRSQERSPAAQNQHRKSGPGTLAVQYNPMRQSSRHQETQAIPQPPRTAPSSPGNAEHMMTGWSSTSNLDHRLEIGSSNHTRQRSGGSNSASNSNRSVDPSNFSRKMSLDSPARKHLSNEPKTPGKEEQRSKLKKIFSGWMTKKEKKEDWMHKLEREGVREGVLVQEGTATSPVVRY